jgi:hypothetical protein
MIQMMKFKMPRKFQNTNGKINKDLKKKKIIGFIVSQKKKKIDGACTRPK